MDRAASIGKLSRTRPSTRYRPFMLYGSKTPGTLMLARMASAREPDSSITDSPLIMSDATARNFRLNESKWVFEGTPMVKRSSWARATFPSSKPAPSASPFLVKGILAAYSARLWRPDQERFSLEEGSANRPGQSIPSTSSARSLLSYPIEYNPPTMAPMEFPVTMSAWIPSSSRTCRTPTWAMPRAPPPSRAIAITVLF